MNGLSRRGLFFVDGEGADFLAGARFTGHEHRRLGRRGAVDDAIDPLHGERRADETGIGMAIKIVLQIGDDLGQLLTFQR